jgi:gliding motility-associated-like protein
MIIVRRKIVSFVRMKRTFTLACFFLLIPSWLLATHNRAGQITFELVSGFTYRVTITTFTYTKSAADRPELLVEWGDNSESLVERISRTVLPNDYYHNIYTTTHTFPGPGIYEIVMQDPNRNYGINNIPNSVNVIFSIKTTLVISPDIGNNSSPVLLNFPIDKAAKGHIFIHNPSAYDPDGDSLSYKMSICTGQDGKPISNYSIPASSDTIYVDPVIGDFVWYSPVDTGKYNVAINIEEWRYGVQIGKITRDMQINVYETDNNPPVNPALKTLCVKAGELIEIQMTSTDVDNDSVKQTMTGGSFVTPNSPATFIKVASGRGFSTSTFRWQTTCDHVRKQPWQLMLKSEDYTTDISLIDIDNFTIKVLAPGPQNLNSSSSSTEINLNWDQSNCGDVAGYYIYRREGPFEFDPDSCENGVPGYTGFVKVGQVSGKQNTAYTDDNNGEGLVQGVSYCYLITAFYPDGGESFASNETCNSLVPGFPALLNVSVTNMDTINGSIFLSWAKPRNFDTIDAPGPYVFHIFRSLTGNDDFDLIDSLATTDLNDTTYIDAPINTWRFPYYYAVTMYNNTPGNRFEMQPGQNETASSLYIEITPGDNRLTLNILKKAPWINEQYVISRKHGSEPFTEIATTNEYIYVDDGLSNGQTYYYQVESIGWRPIDSVIFRNSNISHINYGTAEDVSASCAPVLSVRSLCDSSATNILSWTNPNRTCADDVIRYKLYYSPVMGENLDSLSGISPATDTVFYHRFEPGVSLAGCYAVSAIDSFGNESPLSVIICVDQCSLYELPNVFTPNNDNLNDVYKSKNVNDVVEKVNMKIFNRYGQLIFETEDPDINWNGKFQNNGKEMSTGVYYYICDVYEPRISGLEVRTLVGFIHLYANGDAQPNTK